MSDCYEVALDLLSGRAGGPVPTRRAASGQVPEDALYRDILCSIHPFWLDAATVERASNLRGWAASEILRLAASLRLSDPAANDESVEADLHTSLQIARDQKALAWELRTTTSLAVFLRRRGRSREALDALRMIYAKFTEGLGTADLIVAKALIEELELRP